MTFKHEYTDLTTYIIRGSDGRAYSSNDEGYVAFCQSNTPEKISGDRFISIVDGQVVIDPNKDTTTVSETKLTKINTLKVCTRNYITSDSPNEKRMPEWRCLKWIRYADMYEKKAGGGILSARETAEYDAMIAVGETELSVYNDVLAALGWIQGCIAANDTMGTQIEACTTKAQLDAIDVTRCPYPAWEGWGIAKAFIKPI